MLPYCTQCLAEQRAFIPSVIFDATQQELASLGLKPALASRSVHFAFFFSLQIDRSFCTFTRVIHAHDLIEVTHIRTHSHRFKQRPALRLVRMGEDYIGRMHGADLATKYNPLGQGLDIVEMAAIFGQSVLLLHPFIFRFFL